jgi:hypothetical protein
MLSFCTSSGEVSLVLELSDARWLSEEMSFLAELYRSKAERSEREFGGDNSAALTAFLETQSKCVQLSVALQQALRRGFRRNDHGHPSDQPVAAAPATDLLYPALASPNREISRASPEISTKRVQRTAKPRAAKKEKGPSVRGTRHTKVKREKTSYGGE